MDTFIPSLNITVTDSPIQYNHSKSEHDIILKCYKLVTSGDKNAIKHIKKAVAEFPHLPGLQDYLVKYYYNAGNMSKAIEYNDRLLNQFPNYLFGVVNAALFIDNKKEINRKKDLLGGNKRDITSITTDRDIIHYSEFVFYYDALVKYEIEVENIEEAERALNLLLEVIDEDDEIAINLAHHMIELYLKKGNDRMSKWLPFEQLVESFPTVKIEVPYSKPVFNHKEIDLLYEMEEFVLDNHIIDKLNSLPKDTFTEDLVKMLKDSVVRKNHFTNDYSNFPIHALYFLGSIGAKEHLQDVLNLLRQGEDFIDFWFGDFTNHYFEHCLYSLGKENIDDLYSFLCEPNIYCWHKSLVLDALEQIAHHDKSKRELIVSKIGDIIQFLKDNETNENIFDTRFYTTIISNILNLRATELWEEIEIIYQNKWLDDSYAGALESVKKELFSPYSLYYLQPQPKNIYEYYNNEHHKRRAISPNDNSEFYKKLDSKASKLTMKIMQETFADLNNFDDDYENEVEGDYHDDLPHNPIEDFIVKTTPIKSTKIGRNQPCPCGSGKKYKKCCL